MTALGSPSVSPSPSASPTGGVASTSSLPLASASSHATASPYPATLSVSSSTGETPSASARVSRSAVLSASVAAPPLSLSVEPSVVLSPARSANASKTSALETHSSLPQMVQPSVGALRSVSPLAPFVPPSLPSSAPASQSAFPDVTATATGDSGSTPPGSSMLPSAAPPAATLPTALLVGGGIGASAVVGCCLGLCCVVYAMRRSKRLATWATKGVVHSTPTGGSGWGYYPATRDGPLAGVNPLSKRGLLTERGSSTTAPSAAVFAAATADVSISAASLPGSVSRLTRLPLSPYSSSHDDGMSASNPLYAGTGLTAETRAAAFRHLHAPTGLAATEAAARPTRAGGAWSSFRSSHV